MGMAQNAFTPKLLVNGCSCFRIWFKRSLSKLWISNICHLSYILVVNFVIEYSNLVYPSLIHSHGSPVPMVVPGTLLIRSHMEVSIDGGTTIAGCFIQEIPMNIDDLGVPMGTSIKGNLMKPPYNVKKHLAWNWNHHPSRRIVRWWHISTCADGPKSWTNDWVVEPNGIIGPPLVGLMGHQKLVTMIMARSGIDGATVFPGFSQKVPHFCQ